MKAPEDTAAPDCQQQNKSLLPAAFPSAGREANAECRALRRHKRSLNRAGVKLRVPPPKRPLISDAEPCTTPFGNGERATLCCWREGGREGGGGNPSPAPETNLGWYFQSFLRQIFRSTAPSGANGSSHPKSLCWSWLCTSLRGESKCLQLTVGPAGWAPQLIPSLSQGEFPGPGALRRQWDGL